MPFWSAASAHWPNYVCTFSGPSLLCFSCELVVTVMEGVELLPTQGTLRSLVCLCILRDLSSILSGCSAFHLQLPPSLFAVRGVGAISHWCCPAPCSPVSTIMEAEEMLKKLLGDHLISCFICSLYSSLTLDEPACSPLIFFCLQWPEQHICLSGKRHEMQVTEIMRSWGPPLNALH